MKRIFFLFVFSSFSLFAFSQNFGYGFKAGLNFNRILGPLEEDAQGNVLEESAGNTGFHVGGIFNLKFTQDLGVRAEILYSQKGGRLRYEGPSYFDLFNIDAERTQSTGTRKVTLNRILSYVDVPIGVFYRAFDWLEISAGGNIGLVGGGTGAGQVTYSNGISENSGAVPEFSITLDHDYRRDETGEASFGDGSPFIEVDGDQIEIPTRAGAYYEFDKIDKEPYFNVLDIGVYAGASVFMNKGFFIGLRGNLGLVDMTNNSYDFSLRSLDENGAKIPREDKDVNFSIQASLGFSF